LKIYDDNVNPSHVKVVLSGNSSYKMEFLGGMISSFLVINKKTRIVSTQEKAPIRSQ